VKPIESVTCSLNLFQAFSVSGIPEPEKCKPYFIQRYSLPYVNVILLKKKTFLPNYLLTCFPFYFKIFERANKATKGREKYGSVCFGSIQGEENNNSQTHAV